MNRPSKVAGPCSPSLIPQHGCTTRHLLSTVQIPEENLICSAGGLQVAAIPRNIEVCNVGRVLFERLVLLLKWIGLNVKVLVVVVSVDSIVVRSNQQDIVSKLNFRNPLFCVLKLSDENNLLLTFLLLVEGKYAHSSVFAAHHQHPTIR